MMKSSKSGAVTSPANQGDTSGSGGERNGQQTCTFGRSCNDASLADERAGTKDKILNLRHNNRFGTWNVRSMTDDSKLHIIEREMGRCNIPICGLAEVRWTGKGHFSLDDGHNVYYSGTDRLKRNGVGFILSRETAKCVLGYNPISDRLITIRLQARPVNISVVQAYAPTSTADDETIDSFFHELQETINIEILVNNDAVGKFGLGKANERGERLADFCNENELIVTNTLFQQHPRRLYTWISPDGRTRNQIDYILIKRRWRSSVKVAKTYPGADCGSDHQLLVAEIRSKLKSVKRDTPPRRYDVNRINDQYRVEVRNSFQILLEQEEEWTPNELWEQTKKAISTAAQNNLPKPKKTRSPWISEEVGTMADERRQVKARGIQTEKDEKQYKDLSRRIQRRTRQDKQDLEQ
ncbi:craniofacial development protein 2-like [Amphiura filiformis]|uniref:craniofacial development protein 2-like n=1 Tax=Amphiura filiformis TaxID=82378 RepID=UPI003B20DF52